MKPRLYRGGLSGRVYVATRYDTDADGNPTVVREKHDVTSDFRRIFEEALDKLEAADERD